ncbi:MAG: DUF2452 domain-containing protein [Chitinophagales bacterium]
MPKKESKKQEEKETFINPIDKDKIAENPGLLPYAHTVGGVSIKPIDKGRIKGTSVSAMHQQTDLQMKQIYDQIEVLAKQAREIQKRKEISEHIYAADMSFRPVIGQRYYLYQRSDKNFVLSMIAKDEWGRKMPFEKYLAEVELLADHTWSVIEESEE